MIDLDLSLPRLTGIVALLLLAPGCPPPAPPPPPDLVADPPPGTGGDPGAGVAELDRAEGFVESEAWDEAKVEAEKAIAAQPGSAKAHFILGVAQLNLGDDAAAEKAFEKALELDATVIEARAYLGQAYLMSDPVRAKKAIAVLEPAMKLTEEAPADDDEKMFFVDLHKLIAFAYRAEKKWPQSEKHYEAALALEDSNEVRFNYADMLFASEQADKAGAEMSKLLPAFADDLKTTVALGHRLRKVKAFDGCLTAFTNALKLKPKEPALLMFRGHCHHGLEDEDAARKDYGAALAADPKFQPAYFYMGKSWLASNRRAKAVSAFQKAIRIDRNSKVGKKAQEEMSQLNRR